jgi:hypothetical protein
MPEDRTSHAGADGGSSRSSAISRKISWNICRGIATSREPCCSWIEDLTPIGSEHLLADTAHGPTSRRSETGRSQSALAATSTVLATVRSVPVSAMAWASCRADPRKSSAQKKRDGGWGGYRMRYSARCPHLQWPGHHARVPRDPEVRATREPHGRDCRPGCSPPDNRCAREDQQP